MKLVLETTDGFQTLADDGATDAIVVGVLPGDDIALHHLPAATDDARMQAADLAARPIEDLHVAGGPGGWIAVIDREGLRQHLGRFRAAGLSPTHLVPAALLLPEAIAGRPTLARLDTRILLRSDALGACVEPGLAPAIAGISEFPPLSQIPAFDAGIPASLPLDLLQGDFAPRVAWWKARPFQLTAGLLAALLLAAILAPSWIEHSRAEASIRADDRQTMELAAATLGQQSESAEAAGKALSAARAKAEGRALGPRLGFLADAVSNTPGSYLEQLTLRTDGTMELQAGGAADAINQLGARLQAGPFLFEHDGARMLLGERRPARVPSSPKLAATLRLAEAKQDAAILQAGGGAVVMTAADAAASMAAGLDGSRVDSSDSGAKLVVPAAKATILLPLLAALERQGAQIHTARIERNPDETLGATLEFQ